MPEGTIAAASPPGQSTQARRTVRVGCIEGSSVVVWQETHPTFLRSTSDWDCLNRLCCGCDGDCACERPSSSIAAAMAPPTTMNATQARCTLCFRTVEPSAEPRMVVINNFAHSKLEPQIGEK